MPVRAARNHLCLPGHPSQYPATTRTRRAGTGARPLQHCMTLVGTGPRASPGCRANILRRPVARPKHPATAQTSGPARGRSPYGIIWRSCGPARGAALTVSHGARAGRHGGRAPTVSRDPRRDRPPCQSGPRTNMLRRPVARPKHPATAQTSGPARGRSPYGIIWRLVRAGTGAGPLRYRVILVGTGPRASPAHTLTCSVCPVTRPKHPATTQTSGPAGGRALTITA